jgi:hypothetical protein
MAKKEEESRLAQILRQELKAGRGLADALSNSYREKQKERADLRRYFPKGGVAGLALQSMFGKPYQYKERQTTQQQTAQKKTQTANLSLTKRLVTNSDSMAKDMRIMKINMIRFVKGMGLKPYNERNVTSRVPSRTGTNRNTTTNSGNGGIGGGILGQAVGGLFGAASFVGDVASGIVKGIVSVLGTGFKIGAGILGGVASILGTVVGGVISIGGGVVGGIFRGLASAVSGMGLMGVIALAGAGFLAYRLSKSITGTLDFDTVSDFLTKRLKEFFGMKEGESFKDKIYGGLGKIDEKTGLNTTGVFENIEKAFAKFVGFSTSMIESVVSIVSKTGELAMNEIKASVLRYGTIIAKTMIGIAGVLGGAKLASSLLPLLGVAIGTGGIGGVAIGLGTLFAGGTLAYGTYKGAEALQQQVKDFLTTAVMPDTVDGKPNEKKLLMNKMMSKEFRTQLNDIELLRSDAAGGLDPITNQPVTPAAQMAAARKIDAIKNDKKGVYYQVVEGFKKLYGVDVTDPNFDPSKLVLDDLDKKSEILKRDIGIISKGMYQDAQTSGQFESNKVESEQERRRGATRVSGQTSGETSASQMERLRALIARGESRGDYDIINKEEGGKYKAYKKWKTGAGTLLSESSLNEVLRDMISGRIHAAGKYQFIEGTLKRAMKLAGVSGSDLFNQETQDKLADAWIKETIKGAKTPEEKQKALAKQWAALEYEGGKSYYEGKHNRASVWANEIQEVFNTPTPVLASNEPKPTPNVVPPQSRDFSEIFMEQFDEMFGTNVSIAKQQMSAKEAELKYLATIAKNTEQRNDGNLKSDDPNAPFVPRFSRAI